MICGPLLRTRRNNRVTVDGHSTVHQRSSITACLLSNKVHVPKVNFRFHMCSTCSESDVRDSERDKF